ncbi:MAG: zinc ribbon domain-containing protein [Syntrophomonadaceae bacterium]
MPIFDFKCRECGYNFDMMISYSEKDKVRCPECGAVNPAQLLTPFNTARPGPGVRKPAPDGCNGCAAAGTGG